MINTRFLSASSDFQKFIERIKRMRDDELSTMRHARGEDVFRSQGGYNRLDDVVNLLVQIEAEQQADIEAEE